MLELLRRIDECIPVIDGGKWPYYCHAGGMIFGQLLYSGKDWFDLTHDDTTNVYRLLPSTISKGIRAVVVNQTLIGLAFSAPAICPTVVASEEMAETMRRDMANPTFMNNAATAANLADAIEWAKNAGGTDKVIFFDGSYGSINLSPSLAQSLRLLAPECEQAFAENLPKWLKQRGIDPSKVVHHSGWPA